MTIREIIGQALHYARTCKSLWVFGFFVAVASGGSSGGPGGGQNGGASGDGLSFAQFAPILTVLVLVVIALIVMRFISEGALIEGIARARKGSTMTTGEGFRAGLAHWGVLLRIALLYVAATIASLALLAAPCVVAFLAAGPLGGAAVCLFLLPLAVPWLLTLHLVQAFAARIAVLENRHAVDAIGKARLFLHGRLLHGLKLIVATFAGTLLLILAGLVVVVPVVLLLVALTPIMRVPAVIALGCLALLPAIYVLTAILGTLRSSIWTIGYVTQVES
jgi:hypothetical protein